MTALSAVFAHPDGSLPTWRLIDLGRCDPYVAQTFAESVAVSVATGASENTLLVARPNAPYISLGFHQSFDEELDPAFLATRPVPVIRRVTGGGTTWLDPHQWFYQLVYREDPAAGVVGGPPDLARFLRAPVRCLRDLGVPAELRLPSDLVVAGRKISGNAGGEWEGAHILVGGLLGRTDVEAMAGLLRSPHPEFRRLLRSEMSDRLTSLEGELAHPPRLDELTARLVRAFEEERLLRVRPEKPSHAELARFDQEVRPRHLRPEWFRLPRVLTAPREVVRRVRVAGARFVVAVRAKAGGPLVIGIVDGAHVERAHVLGPGERHSSAATPAELRMLERGVPGAEPDDRAASAA